jgi:diguanylate cyclase (GGDEF)-like protein
MGYWISVVDDDAQSLSSARIILGEGDMRVSCLRSGNDFLKFIDKNSPDLVLLDVMMPQMDGFETYKALREYEKNCGKPNIPVIFLTGENDSETEQKGLKLGASDFIRKPLNKEVLLKRIDNTLKSLKAIETLTEEAMFDKLTGFLNKARGTERISRLCTRIQGSLMIMDLDNFKLVNDLFGHDMGDKVLQAFSSVVRRNTRETDTISRIGGDEFLAFYENLLDESALSVLTLRLNTELTSEAAALMGEDNGIPLGISIGCVFVPEHGSDFDKLFAMADGALYTAKHNGKHGYYIYSTTEETDHSSRSQDENFDRILKTIQERNEKAGALFLGRDSFAVVYRFVMRFYKRYSGTAALLLFTVTCDEQSDNIELLEYMQQLENVLAHTLRVSDIIMQSGANSFFIMLTERTPLEAQTAVNRIMHNWEESCDSGSVKVEYLIRYINNLEKEDNEAQKN